MLAAVRRPNKERPEDAETDIAPAADDQALVFEIPPQPLRNFGLVMSMGPITAVQVNSPADKAGIVEGDVIELVDGKPMAETHSDRAGWTSLTLPDYLRRAAVEGREVEFTVRRKSRENTGEEQIAIRVTPVVPIAIYSGIPPGAPLAADAIGIAYRIENEVHAVEPNDATSGIAAGDLITAATIHLPADDKGKQPKPVPIELGPDQPNWPALVDAVQSPGRHESGAQRQRGEQSEPQTVAVSPQPIEGVFIAPRGFIFEPVVRIRTAETFAEQVRYGWDETLDALTMVFRFLQKLGGQVPLKMLGGPGTIAVAAGAAFRKACRRC